MLCRNLTLYWPSSYWRTTQAVYRTHGRKPYGPTVLIVRAQPHPACQSASSYSSLWSGCIKPSINSNLCKHQTNVMTTLYCICNRKQRIDDFRIRITSRASAITIRMPCPFHIGALQELIPLTFAKLDSLRCGPLPLAWFNCLQWQVQ